MIGRQTDRFRAAGPFVAVLLTAVLVLAACGGDDSNETTTTTAATATTAASEDTAPSTTQSPEAQRQPEGASAFFSIEEILLGPDGYVTLNNFTSVPVTLDGLHLCQGADCFALPDEVVPPGGNAYIAVGAAPDVEGTVVTGATIGVLDPPNGETALYVTDPDDPAFIIAYLEWGSTPHDRTADAIAAGLWLEDSYAPSGDNAVRLFRDPDSGLWLWDAA